MPLPLTLNKFSALQAIRHLRSARVLRPRAGRRKLACPEPLDGKRWTASKLTMPWVNGGEAPTSDRPIHVAVPTPESRIQSKCASNTVYSPEAPVIPLIDGVDSVSPELLFVEMAAVMELPVLVMLGLELCGTFSRDAVSPRDGEVTYGLEPITTAERIRDFAANPQITRLPGKKRARRAARFLMDNAWSPREALIASIIALPIEELGFELGHVTLNKRLGVGAEGILTDAATRVPDILFPGTHVGLNYDGDPHYGADGAEDARAHSVRDKLRDRDLFLEGYSVLPVVHEDLSTRGAFDALIYRVIDLLENETGESYELQRSKLVRVRMAGKRQRLIWSMLPGERGRRISREGVWQTSRETEVLVSDFVL